MGVQDRAFSRLPGRAAMMATRNPDESRRRPSDPAAGGGRSAARRPGAGAAARGARRAGLGAGRASRGPVGRRAADERRRRAPGQGEPRADRAAGDRCRPGARGARGARLGGAGGAAFFLARGAVAQPGVRLHPAPRHPARGGGPPLLRGRARVARGPPRVAPADRRRPRRPRGPALRLAPRLLARAELVCGLARGFARRRRQGPDFRGRRAARERGGLRRALRPARRGPRAQRPQGALRAGRGAPRLAAGARRAGRRDLRERSPGARVGRRSAGRGRRAGGGGLWGAPLPALRLWCGRGLCRVDALARRGLERLVAGLPLARDQLVADGRRSARRSPAHEGAAVRGDLALADRAEAVRGAARAWRRAGAIDAAALAAVEERFPDDRVRVGTAFRVLLFLFTVGAAAGGWGFVALLLGSSQLDLAAGLAAPGGVSRR